MKKTVKGLIIAASVAAVVGVGAVSYAAWSANAPKTVDKEGATTSVVATIGNITVTGNFDKKLAPYDQSANSNAVLTDTTAVEMWNFNIANDAAADTNVKYYIGLTEALNSSKVGDAKLYYSTSYNPSADGASVNLTAKDGDKNVWEELSTVVVKTQNSENYGHELGAKTVYVVLDASGSDAQTMDIKLTFSAVQG